MDTRTYNKLVKLGYSKEFIKSISTFRKDRKKRFELRVTDMGEFICYACFSTVEECREICEKLEGFAFTLKDTAIGEKIFADGGVIDDCACEIFEELVQKTEKTVTYYWRKGLCGTDDEIVARSYKTGNKFIFENGRASGEERDAVSNMRKFVANRSIRCHTKDELEHEVRCLRRQYRYVEIFLTEEEYR